ncbi:MAG: glycosyltransferase [Acidobacteriaceae bacterium]|nr:glycosyltransferase [Acidobacteriaceae bacterium]
MKAPHVSVVLPMFNAERYIDRCLKALVTQSYPRDRYEILLVDNNSTDGSREIARKYPQVRLLSEPKQGAYAARNCGVKNARGEILAFIDPDCVASTDWLVELTAPFGERATGLVHGRRIFGNGSSLVSLIAAYETEIAAYIFSGTAERGFFGYTNNMAVRRDIFEQCGPFLETARGADSVFVQRVVDRYSPGVLRYAREACVDHLEITSLREWLRKKRLYGRSFENHRAERLASGSLTIRERSLLLGLTVERRHYSQTQRALLLGAVWMGNLSFRYGRLRGRHPKWRLGNSSAAKS